jgi:hypothetical protein
MLWDEAVSAKLVDVLYEDISVLEEMHTVNVVEEICEDFNVLEMSDSEVVAMLGSEVGKHSHHQLRLPFDLSQ